MTPQILRTGAKVAEKRGNPICASQLRAAADEIERLRKINEELEAAAEAEAQKYEDYAVRGLGR